MPTSRTCHAVAFWPTPFAPHSRNPYCPATWARLAMTRTSAATMAQPPAHPVLGPKARVPQANVVPQSGAALFISLQPIEDSDRGGLESDGGHDKEQRRRKAVSGRGRGHSHNDAGDQAEGA